MAFDIVPGNFLRFPVNQSVWDELTDIDNWFSAYPNSAAISGLSISEDDQHVYIEASVPGVDPKNVDVTFHKGILWIKGKTDEEEKKKKYYRKATSAFSYRVPIPEEVDEKSDPVAECSKGVMKVTFVKSSKTQPKKIAVKAIDDETNGKKK